MLDIPKQGTQIDGVARVLADSAKSSAAEAEYRNALVIRQKLADGNPTVTEFRGNLAWSHYTIGNMLSKPGKTSEAEAEFRKPLTIRQKLADDNPAVTEFRDGLRDRRRQPEIILL